MTAIPTPTPMPAAAPADRPELEELPDDEGGDEADEDGEEDEVEDGEDDANPRFWPLVMSATACLMGTKNTYCSCGRIRLVIDHGDGREEPVLRWLFRVLCCRARHEERISLMTVHVVIGSISHVHEL